MNASSQYVKFQTQMFNNTWIRDLGWFIRFNGVPRTIYRVKFGIRKLASPHKEYMSNYKQTREGKKCIHSSVKAWITKLFRICVCSINQQDINSYNTHYVKLCEELQLINYFSTVRHLFHLHFASCMLTPGQI